MASREDFASTGGSVYFFRNRDIAPGSERVFLEVRDKDSGLVLQSQDLVAGIDYEINAMQGRVLLLEDDAAGREALAGLLQRWGCEVWACADRLQAQGLQIDDGQGRGCRCGGGRVESGCCQGAHAVLPGKWEGRGAQAARR